MPLTSGKRVVLVDAASYCSVPPLTYSRVTLPPRLTRAAEARHPRAPLRAVKAEVRESEANSVEFAVNDEDVKPEVASIKIELDPRQFLARVAAISIRQPPQQPRHHPRRPRGPAHRHPLTVRSRCAASHPASWARRTHPDGPGDRKGPNPGHV